MKVAKLWMVMRIRYDRDTLYIEGLNNETLMPSGTCGAQLDDS